MSESSVKSFHLKQPDGDEIEKSIEFLDKVLSEFEDPDSLPHIEQEPETPTQGNQSEDDGYMSMNGKKELKVIDVDGGQKNKKFHSEIKSRNEIICCGENADVMPEQTTLPKVRPVSVEQSKYASLPCSNLSKAIHSDADTDPMFANGRIKLGIDISAVHDAVLRGVARIPETFANEHPVTIYPGPPSPVRTKPAANRKVIGSTHDLTDQVLKLRINDDSSEGDDDCDTNNLEQENHSNVITIGEDMNDKSKLSQSVSMTSFDNRRSLLISEDDFSDDSLENGAIPMVTHVPKAFEGKASAIELPKSLDAEIQPFVSPSNLNPGIAWEIKLDCANDDGDADDVDRFAKQTFNPPFPINSHLIDDSVASTPCNSILSTDYSSDWPDPPENPICSTEDEAGSIITDSEDVIPLQTTIIPNGTYVIRKGRDRKQVFDIPEFVPMPGSKHQSEVESLLESSQEILNIDESNDIPEPPINIPKYRHSIDLALPSMQTSILSNRHSAYNSFWTKADDIQIPKTNSLTPSKRPELFAHKACDSPNRRVMIDDSGMPLTRVASLPIISPLPPPPTSVLTSDIISTPRRELAPAIEEDEEPESESQGNGPAPLRQIESNISAILRGEVSIARVPELQTPRRPLGLRAGVHKSESAKEMLLSQHMFGALPPSPPSSSADEIDGLPPLPPLPTESNADIYENKVWPDSHGYRSTSLGKNKYESRYRDSIESVPPVPPHRCPSADNTLRTMSMDSKYYKKNSVCMSPHTPGSTHSHDRIGISNSRKRMPGAYLKHTTPSPHEERRLQTSCSLPETPIFARGCDIPRTPHRRTQEISTGSRLSSTAPRPMNSLNSSIVGIAGSTLNGRPGQRNINQALLSSEMLRIAGGPGRGWYPKQKQNRPVSNENLDRIHSTGRSWDASAASRKPLTLPPNLSPHFFKKSPTDALRRVTSLLIRNKGNTKEEKKEKRDSQNATANRSFESGTSEHNGTHKKRGFFKNFWKKAKHHSMEQ